MMINSNKNKSHHPPPHFLDPKHKGSCNCNSGKNLDDSGCCEGIKNCTPVDIENPPSLSSIRYRIGTHGMFKAAMLTNLSRKPVLSRLTTRDDNDLAIAIIDSWATIADVITFYQERIANEGFLRTLKERKSVLELARSVGYELGSGVASDTLLAFMVEENNPSIEKTIIQVGTKVQSIPHQGEIPQTFETIEMIEARPELNEIKANTVVAHTIDRNTTTLYFEGMDTKLRQDDMLLVVDKGSEQNPKFFAQVLNVKTDEKKNVTIANIMIVWPSKSKSLKDVNTDTLSIQNAGSTTNKTSSIKISFFSGDKNENFSSGNGGMATKTEDRASSSPMMVREMNSSELTSLAVKMNVSEKELIEDQNKAAKQNMQNQAPNVYAFRQKAAIFGHDAP